MHPLAMIHSPLLLALLSFIIVLFVAYSILVFANKLRGPFANRRVTAQTALKAAVTDSVIDCILIVNRRGWIIEWNPAAERTFGCTRSEALRRTLFDFLFPIDQNGQEAAALFQRLNNYDKAVIGKRIEMDAFRANGSKFPAEITITAAHVGGQPVYITHLRDLTEKKKVEDMINQLAYYDLLTGLPNRNQFHQFFVDMLDAARSHEHSVAVLFLDINRFKHINDTLGHPVGDQVLQKFSALLSRSLAAESIASRLSGDEFVILMSQANRESAARQAESVIRQLYTPFSLNERDVVVSTSIGIAIFPEDGEDTDVLLKHADQAMYAAKERGPGRYQFFEPSMNRLYNRRIAIEQALRHALDNGEFALAYQPAFHLPTGAMIGVEALLRWENAQLGSIKPKEFIPIAEESGQISAIENWVLRTACAQMKAWHDAGMIRVPIAVHVSAIQLHERLAPTLSAILQETGLDARYVELEISESTAMINDSDILEQLIALKNLGLSLVLDNFGAGSSLNVLRHVPVDTLKIDKSFVHAISASQEEARMVSAIVAMARSLKLNVIAEGVETQEQLLFLDKHGCHLAQGYMLCVPLTAAQFASHYVYPAAMAHLEAL
ncbi:putative bifunctional diguanylate cyclase/phosphodiesterase [Paenibacillus aestuarii]|uniref:Bifunctional diguanylate cyclase/phosphodiesterase n=1 Tax=Paenibacillus aestuarii TaxID=516965 RepID=A0ABW0K3M8_9BACL|nr:EAL domain-containing protein [Paenibacillus aestuarii]